MIHVKIVMSDGVETIVQNLFFVDMAVAKSSMLRRFEMYEGAGWNMERMGAGVVILSYDDLIASFTVEA